MEGSSQVDDVSGWVWRGLALLLMSLLGWATMEAVSWLWLAPRRMERLLRAQRIPGNPYRLLLGDILEDMKMAEEAKLKPFSAFSHDITARVLPSIHKALATHGKFCFTWLGTHARVNIADPVLIREVLSNTSGRFRKPEPTPILRFILTGLVTHEGEKWATHRRIVSPALHVEKLKRMSATFYDCCTELVGRWERLLGPEGSCEIDAQLELQNLTKDIISWTAFGSSFEKGRRIFELLEEQTALAARLFMYCQIPAYRYIPTKKNRRMKEVYREVHEILRNMILERQKAVRSGVASNDDLLGLLLESNLSYSSEKGELKRSGMTTERGFGMTTEDMIEE